MRASVAGHAAIELVAEPPLTRVASGAMPSAEGAWAMVSSDTPFTQRMAPCGHLMDGSHHERYDEQGLVSDLMVFECGCRIDREEYHDGSIEHTVIRHDGKVLTDHVGIDHGS